jgi:RNA recognition motif-containing protein
MNLRVTNLSLHVVENDLQKLFSKYGEVGFVMIEREKKSGRSRGNAFIEMPIQAQGEQAIRALDKSEVDGQTISVYEIEYKAGEFNN